MRRPRPAAPARLRFGLPATAGLAVMATLAAGCSGSATSGATGAPVSSPGTGSAAAAASASPLVSASASVSPWPVVVPVPVVTAGLHQTRALPAAHGAVFQGEMTDLWAGVVSGRPDLAMSAFFPLVAYEQVKAIADPAADWRDRLVAEFRADVLAAHDLIGRAVRNARLVRVVVPEQQAGWIDPGVCYNGVGYWHVAGARVVYQLAGQERSVGIASLISWRGRWYVVHFGGEVRTGPGGMVDQPALGPGVPGPPGGC
jgi:hypothetical protein